LAVLYYFAVFAPFVEDF